MNEDSSRTLYHDYSTLAAIATAIKKHPRCLKYTAEKLARSVSIDLRDEELKGDK